MHTSANIMKVARDLIGRTKTSVLLCHILTASFLLLVVPMAVGNVQDADHAPEAGTPVYRPGLVTHYYDDPDQWDGQWPQESNVPFDDARNWTFTQYRYSRIEPLINHLFINRGWFSIRWVGWFDPAPGTQSLGDDDYVFEIWADDGARLFLNGKTLIDDWNARWEESPASWRRSRTVRLAPGKHRIVVEYFQGLSQESDDHDPMKLFWSSPSRGFRRRIIPATHFRHTTADLR